MELYKEILVAALAREPLQITIPGFHINPAELIELECYNALQKVQAIIQDDCLNDKDCFLKIEEIVSLLEALGSSGGGRHDFG